MRRLILFLIRRKLGIKKYENFKFNNQKSKNNFYFFYDFGLLKADVDCDTLRDSHVSLAWLLSDECKIIKL